MSREQFLVTDLTRMTPTSVCIAGYVRRKGNLICIRPVLPWSDRSQGLIAEDVLFAGRSPVTPFTIVDLDLYEEDSDPPHVEDVVFSGDFTQIVRRLGLQNRQAILHEVLDPSIETIFDGSAQRSDSGNAWVEHGTLCRSLGTVEAFNIRVYFDHFDDSGWKYRIQFEDEIGTAYKLAITDLAARRYLQSLVRDVGMSQTDASISLRDLLQEAQQVILRIGLARPFEFHRDRCYLLVTGIYSFPDYLDGRTHADFPRDYA